MVQKGLLGALGAVGLAVPAVQAVVGGAALLAGALPTDPSSVRGAFKAASSMMRRPPAASA